MHRMSCGRVANIATVATAKEGNANLCIHLNDLNCKNLARQTTEVENNYFSVRRLKKDT